MESKDIQVRIIDSIIFVKVGTSPWCYLYHGKIRYIDRFDQVTTVMFTNGSFLMINDYVRQVTFGKNYSEWMNVVAVRRSPSDYIRPTYEYFLEENIVNNDDTYPDDILKLLEELNNDEKVEGI